MIFGISILGVVFLSTLSLRRATPAWLPYFPMEQRFLSTLSLRRATNARPEIRQLCAISIHALLAESDQAKALKVSTLRISIHALLAESDNVELHDWPPVRISIHALLAESDARRPGQTAKANKISIHALLAESDDTLSAQDRPKEKFLSTLSLRRATTSTITICTVLKFLSTLSLRRATANSHGERQGQHISIHALLAESDPPVREIIQWEGIFLSTLSLRRAT